MSAVAGFLAAGALAFTPIQVDGLFIDGFAGAGGASTGIEQAIGRSPDIAINHSQTALAIHAANHPETEHHCTDIRMPFLPGQAVAGRIVAGAWFSPDCKEFSKAKGGPVKDRSIRALCWEVIHWLKETQPTCGYLENVEEFAYAAPLDADGRPIAGQAGREFKRFVRAIRALGYRVQWRILKACDYGTPTSRKRLYMVMRNDGKPIVWPKATHGAPDSTGVRSGRLLPYRTAAECIDWTIPCPSIFDRQKELVEATKHRLAHGVVRYVIEAAAKGTAFIVPVTHTGGIRVQSLRDPLRTITTANGGEFALGQVKIAPHITKYHGTGVGSPGDNPMPTVTANGQPTRPAGATPLGLVEATLAFMSTFNGSDTKNGGGEVAAPLKTTRAGGQHHAVVAAHIEQANTGMVGRSAKQPLSTIVGKGSTQRIVETTLVEEGALSPALMERAVVTAAFLVKYYGEGGQSQAVNRPLDVVTTKARYAVVTVTIDAVTYIIVDIGLRMLKPRELANAQGFPPDYILDPIVRKQIRGKWVERRLSIAEQISGIGNSVCPPVARALILANQPAANDNAPAVQQQRRAA